MRLDAISKPPAHEHVHKHLLMELHGMRCHAVYFLYVWAVWSYFGAPMVTSACNISPTVFTWFLCQIYQTLVFLCHDNHKFWNPAVAQNPPKSTTHQAGAAATLKLTKRSVKKCIYKYTRHRANCTVSQITKCPFLMAHAWHARVRAGKF